MALLLKCLFGKKKIINAEEIGDVSPCLQDPQTFFSNWSSRKRVMPKFSVLYFQPDPLVEPLKVLWCNVCMMFSVQLNFEMLSFICVFKLKLCLNIYY